MPRLSSRAPTLGGYAPGGMRQAPPVCRMMRPRPLECAGPGESSPNRVPAFGGRKPEGATQRRNKRLGGACPGESSPKRIPAFGGRKPEGATDQPTHRIRVWGAGPGESSTNRIPTFGGRMPEGADGAEQSPGPTAEEKRHAMLR